MSFNHLVLVGGGHSNVLLLRKWLMKPSLMPACPISIISRDFNLVYSAMYPGIVAQEFKIDEALIDIYSLASRTKISFIKDEIVNINFLQKKILFEERPFIKYSKLVLNFGSITRIDSEFSELVRSQKAFTIKPFNKSLQIIKSEDSNNIIQALPFVIVGSGLAAIEMAFALRKRWSKRKLILICNPSKINNKILNGLKKRNVNFKEKIDFEFGKVLLCTGNQSPKWIKNNLLKLDRQGRINTNLTLQVNDFPDVFAVGDCAVVTNNRRPPSGIFAVRVVNKLAINLRNDFQGKKLENWFPQKRGLQIVKTFSSSKTFVIFGNLTIQSSTFFGKLKNNIDANFVKKFKISEMKWSKKITLMEDLDCRGCAAKIPQNVLNNSLRDSQLGKFADFPEDASEVYKFDNKIFMQSVDGFPALISDPWLNAKITTLHACSDLWACGVKLSSINTLISLPKVEKDFQNYLCTHILNGINSVVYELKGEVLGGHTYESRNFTDKPYSLGIDISLTVNGYLGNGKKSWKKSGMKSGDIILLSRPLGVGIFFAAQMRNINLFKSSSKILKNLLTSQQNLIEDIYLLQESLGEKIINASTDITGFGLLGHLKEMVDASNDLRIKQRALASQTPQEIDINLV